MKGNCLYFQLQITLERYILESVCMSLCLCLCLSLSFVLCVRFLSDLFVRLVERVDDDVHSVLPLGPLPVLRAPCVFISMFLLCFIHKHKKLTISRLLGLLDNLFYLARVLLLASNKPDLANC